MTASKGSAVEGISQRNICQSCLYCNTEPDIVKIPLDFLQDLTTVQETGEARIGFEWLQYPGFVHDPDERRSEPLAIGGFRCLKQGEKGGTIGDRQQVRK